MTMRKPVCVTAVFLVLAIMFLGACSGGEDSGPKFASMTVIFSFATPDSNPQGLAWDGANLWLSSNGEKPSDRIYRISAAGAVVSSFAPVIADPWGLAYDGANLWAVASLIHRLTSPTTYDIGFAPPGTAFGAAGLAWDGSSLWHCNWRENVVYQLSTAGDVLSSFEGPGTQCTGLAWDGANLWIADSDQDRIYKVTTAGAALLYTDSPGPLPHGLAWDGSRLWVVDWIDNRVYRIRVSG